MARRIMIFALYATPIFISLAKPIALIGSAVIEYYKFGIMDLLFVLVNVPYVDARSPCWFLTRFHQGSDAILKLLRFYRGQKDKTVFLVNIQMVLCRECKIFPFFSRDCHKILSIHKDHFRMLCGARVFLAMIVSAIYVLSPVDIIPEALLGIIGLLDDFIIVLIYFLYVAALYRSVLVLRHGGS